MMYHILPMDTEVWKMSVPQNIFPFFGGRGVVVVVGKAPLPFVVYFAGKTSVFMPWQATAVQLMTSSFYSSLRTSLN